METLVVCNEIAQYVHEEVKLIYTGEVVSIIGPSGSGKSTLLRDLAKERMTMLVVTHEMAFAREIPDRVIFMDEGRVLAAGLPEAIFEHPELLRIRSFISRKI